MRYGGALRCVMLRYGGMFRCVALRYFDALRQCVTVRYGDMLQYVTLMRYGVRRWCVTTVCYDALLRYVIRVRHGWDHTGFRVGVSHSLLTAWFQLPPAAGTLSVTPFPRGFHDAFHGGFSMTLHQYHFP